MKKVLIVLAIVGIGAALWLISAKGGEV